MIHKKNRKLYLLIASIVLLYSLFIACISVLSFPEEINVIQGQYQKILNNIVFSLNPDQSEIDNKQIAKLTLFGIVPVKKVTFNIIPDITVIPSGESIGVKIQSKGLLVVGLSSITDINNKKVSPAADAGIEIGDIICRVDNIEVETEQDIIDIINSKGKVENSLTIDIKRKNKQLSIKVNPVLCKEDNIYKIGVWVRNGIAGVGTMTFYDPKSGKFGALGHGIADIDSGVMIDIDKGVILKSKVASIQKAKRSVPGEIVGIFYDSNIPYGNIIKNTPYGIYGRLNQVNNNYANGLKVALCSEIKEGPATILTTIEDDKVQEFSIEIVKVIRQKTKDSKSMVIKVTDPILIEKTGGIVQGMSGSPIIQDGKIVGAITHVLINDPKKGYGVSIEWMLSELSDY